MSASTVAALASGVLLALSFPKYGHPALAFIALVPLYVALSGWNGQPRKSPGVSTGKGFRLGLIAGFIHFAGTVYWTGATVQTFGGLPRDLQPLHHMRYDVAAFSLMAFAEWRS